MAKGEPAPQEGYGRYALLYQEVRWTNFEVELVRTKNQINQIS